MDAPDMTDEEAEGIKDACRALAEVMFEQWQHEQEIKNKKDEYEQQPQ